MALSRIVSEILNVEQYDLYLEITSLKVMIVLPFERLGMVSY